MRRFLRSTGSLFEIGSRLVRRSARGFLFATALLLLADRAAAQPANGSTRVNDLVIEWDYDLPNGLGLLMLRVADDPVQFNDFHITHSSFDTRGLTYDDAFVLSAGMTLRPFYPTLSGIGATGREIWRYRQASNVEFILPNLDTAPTSGVTLNLQFPTTGVELVESTFGVAGRRGEHYPANEFVDLLDFVTIQTIPEPATGAALLAGGISAVAMRRRKTS